MRPFRFSLDRVLQYKESLEKEAKQRLAGARQAESECKIALDTLQREWEQRQQVLNHGKLDLPVLIYHQQYLETLERKVHQKKVELEEHRKLVDKYLSEVKQKMLGRKVLEKLKDKRVAEHRYWQDRQEQKELDHVSTVIYLRGKS